MLDQSKRLVAEKVFRAVKANNGVYQRAAKELDMSKDSVRRYYRLAVEKFGMVENDPGFEVLSELPSPDTPIDELLQRRIAEFDRLHRAKSARQMINVQVKIAGPWALNFFGDPHTDDPGTDLRRLLMDAEITRRTPGMFAGNVGDNQNNWVGRLARLYGEQSTSKAESWKLTEHFIKLVDWLFFIKGNHDAWSGAGDPLDWILKDPPGIVEPFGARLQISMPGTDRCLRINVRHNFPGLSQWNRAHAVAKAAQLGGSCHIYAAGHLHLSGYQTGKNPETGLQWHALQVGSYKIYDRYAEEKNLPDHNLFSCATAIIDQHASNEVQFIRFIFGDVEFAADLLNWMRKRWEAGKSYDSAPGLGAGF